MWNDRFAGDEYHYGTAPADFLTRHVGHIPAGGRVLSVGEGEGRNAVWLAAQGFEVTATDGAPNAARKARQLAAERGVRLAYDVADITERDWAPEAYEAVLGIFIQFARPPVQAKIMEGMKRSLRPGGVVLLHGFAPRQVGYGSGGPPNPEQMYTEDLLRDRFADFEILALRDYDAEIAEGRGHRGLAALVDLVARKPG